MTGLNLTNSSSTVLASYAQTFSDSSHKKTVSESTGRGENYAYDLLYRLTNETISGDPTTANNGSLAYGLDPVANRRTLTSTLAALPSQNFSYDADDRLASDTYDANGNTLTSGGMTCPIRFRGSLVSTSTGVQIVYDGDGNRASEIAAGVTRKYLVDEQTPTGYAQVAEELGGGSLSAQFVYGWMRVNQSRGGVTSYYGYDAGGSTRQLLSPAAAVTDTYSYDAFGNTVAQLGTTLNEFQYRGEQSDDRLGMYYLRARYNVPRTGRFLTADKFDGSSDCHCTVDYYTADAHHLYAYAEADSAGRVDRSGFDSGDEGAIQVAAASSAVRGFATRVVAISYGASTASGASGAVPFLLSGLGAGIVCVFDLYLSAQDEAAVERGDYSARKIAPGVCSIPQAAKTSKRTQKEKSSNYPSWVDYYDRYPRETCADYAARILREQYGAGSTRAEQRGPGSEYNQIVKACERGGR